MDSTLESVRFAYRPAGTSPASAAAFDELGLWTPQAPLAEAAGEPGEESFGAPGSPPVPPAPPPTHNHFLVELPSDATLAGQALETQTARLKRSESGVLDGKRRLELFAREGGLPLEASFSQPGLAAPALARPELELQGWLDAAGPEESFAVLPKLPDDLKETARAASEFFDKIHRLLTSGDIIESCQGGSRVGMTIISLTGDFTTIWGDSGNRAVSTLHQQVLTQSIATRAAWMTLAASVVGGAVKLAVLFPTSPWLAIPAAYKFFRQVLEQVQNWPTSN